jgi:hypothetical protein
MSEGTLALKFERVPYEASAAFPGLKFEHMSHLCQAAVMQIDCIGRAGLVFKTEKGSSFSRRRGI